MNFSFGTAGRSIALHSSQPALLRIVALEELRSTKGPALPLFSAQVLLLLVCRCLVLEQSDNEERRVAGEEGIGEKRELEPDLCSGPIGNFRFLYRPTWTWCTVTRVGWALGTRHSLVDCTLVGCGLSAPAFMLDHFNSSLGRKDNSLYSRTQHTTTKFITPRF